MILARLSNDKDIEGGLTYVKGATGNCQRDASLEVEITDMGTYALFVQMEWKNIPNEAVREYSVTRYGPGSIGSFE